MFSADSSKQQSSRAKHVACLYNLSSFVPSFKCFCQKWAFQWWYDAHCLKVLSSIYLWTICNLHLWKGLQSSLLIMLLYCHLFFYNKVTIVLLFNISVWADVMILCENWTQVKIRFSIKISRTDQFLVKNTHPKQQYKLNLYPRPTILLLSLNEN